MGAWIQFLVAAEGSQLEAIHVIPYEKTIVKVSSLNKDSRWHESSQADPRGSMPI